MTTATAMVMFSARSYDRDSFERAREAGASAVVVRYVEARLTVDSAPLAAGAPAVCAFVNDDLSAPVLEVLAAGGTSIVALRSAGFNHVDLATATRPADPPQAGAFTLVDGPPVRRRHRSSSGGGRGARRRWRRRRGAARGRRCRR